MYVQGFRKIDSDTWEFANESFVRNNREALCSIQRRIAVNPAARAEALRAYGLVPQQQPYTSLPSDGSKALAWSGSMHDYSGTLNAAADLIAFTAQASGRADPRTSQEPMRPHILDTQNTDSPGYSHPHPHLSPHFPPLDVKSSQHLHVQSASPCTVSVSASSPNPSQHPHAQSASPCTVSISTANPKPSQHPHVESVSPCTVSIPTSNPKSSQHPQEQTVQAETVHPQPSTVHHFSAPQLVSRDASDSNPQELTVQAGTVRPQPSTGPHFSGVSSPKLISGASPDSSLTAVERYSRMVATVLQPGQQSEMLQSGSKRHAPDVGVSATTAMPTSSGPSISGSGLVVIDSVASGSGNEHQASQQEGSPVKKPRPSSLDLARAPSNGQIAHLNTVPSGAPITRKMLVI